MKDEIRAALRILRNEGVIECCRSIYFYSKYGTQLHRHFYYCGRSNAEHELIYINPNDIFEETRSNFGSFLDHPFGVYSGNWDKRTSKFSSREAVIGLKRHFNENIDWEQTTYYQNALSTLESGCSWRNCKNKRDIDQQFNSWDELYTDMKNNGYKNKDQDVPIGVNISRDGSLLWQYEGQHRLCIAQILDIDCVPVKVMIRHKKWENIRNKIARTDNISSLPVEIRKFSQHPDVRSYERSEF